MSDTRRVLVPIALLLLLAAPSLAEAPRRSLSLYENLPQDPLLVLGLSLDKPGLELDSLFDLVGRLSAEEAQEQSDPISGLKGNLASWLPPDLLSALGPELTLTVDLPPIDETVAAFQYSTEEAMGFLLARAGLVAEARDAERLDGMLREMFRNLGGELAEDERVVRVRLPLAGTDPPGSFNLFYAVDDARLALGFSPSWVRSAFVPKPEGQRLVDGEDFSRVFGELDERPTDLIYLNLPKVHRYIRESQIVRAVLQTNSEAASFVDQFMTPETMNVGIGSTTVSLPHGVRTTYFGPSWMSGAAMSGGMLAAMAVPGLLTSMDRERADRTRNDIEAIASACEGFSLDSKSYPGPTDGWVPVEKIATYLEPVYITRLPRQDGWRNPILYWSDGGSFRIVSTGKDGRMDQDWSAVSQPAPSPGPAADIVRGNGE